MHRVKVSGWVKIGMDGGGRAGVAMVVHLSGVSDNQDCTLCTVPKCAHARARSQLRVLDGMLRQKPCIFYYYFAQILSLASDAPVDGRYEAGGEDPASGFWGRVYTSSVGNWLHGHWGWWSRGPAAGVLHWDSPGTASNTWVIYPQPRGRPLEDCALCWLTMCTKNGDVRPPPTPPLH